MRRVSYEHRAIDARRRSLSTVAGACDAPPACQGTRRVRLVRGEGRGVSD